MVKYHTDEEIVMKCLDHRAYPMAVVQDMLRVDPRRSIINGIKNILPDGVQPPKQISFLSSALEYANPALDASVYGQAQVSAIKKKMDSQLIMENLQVRGAMVPPGRGMKQWGRSRLEQEQFRRTKMLEDKLDKDALKFSKEDREDLVAMKLQQNRLRNEVVMTGQDFVNPGEQGFTFNMGLSGTTAISQPTLFEPRKVKRQQKIKLKIMESAELAGVKIPVSEPIKRPRGRAKVGTAWDSNRGMWVADPNFKGVNWFEREENKMMKEEDYLSKIDQMKQRRDIHEAAAAAAVDNAKSGPPVAAAGEAAKQ